MRRIGNVGMGMKLFPLVRVVQSIAMVLFLLFCAASAAAEGIAVFPATPYDAYIIYESLALFWVAIIGLIVIIRMKLREIERVQGMGKDREEGEPPLLE
jgi:hypothetical protein